MKFLRLTHQRLVPVETLSDAVQGLIGGEMSAFPSFSRILNPILVGGGSAVACFSEKFA